MEKANKLVLISTPGRDDGWVKSLFLDAPSDSLERAAAAAGFTLIDEDMLRNLHLGEGGELAGQAMFSEHILLESPPCEMFARREVQGDPLPVDHDAIQHADTARKRAGIIALLLFLFGLALMAALSLYPHG